MIIANPLPHEDAKKKEMAEYALTYWGKKFFPQYVSDIIRQSDDHDHAGKHNGRTEILNPKTIDLSTLRSRCASGSACQVHPGLVLQAYTEFGA